MVGYSSGSANCIKGLLSVGIRQHWHPVDSFSQLQTSRSYLSVSNLPTPYIPFKMMFSFKSLAVAAGIAFAAISSVVATPTPCPTCDVTTTTTYVQEKSLVYVLEKTKYEITPVVHKFRK